MADRLGFAKIPCNRRKESTDSAKDMKAEPDSKEYILNGMKEAINSLNDYKAGKIQTRPLDELIRELETEEE